MSHILAARIASLSTAVPPHILDTDHVVKQAGRIFARFGSEFERMLPVFTNTGITRRYSVCPTDWFNEVSNWPERTKRFLEGAKLLFREATAKALTKPPTIRASPPTPETVPESFCESLFCKAG